MVARATGSQACGLPDGGRCATTKSSALERQAAQPPVTGRRKRSITGTMITAIAVNKAPAESGHTRLGSGVGWRAGQVIEDNREEERGDADQWTMPATIAICGRQPELAMQHVISGRAGISPRRSFPE